MKILIEGRLPEKQVFRGTCYHCNTRFECERSEGKFVSDQREGDFLNVTCPLCKKTATAYAVKEGISYR